jgi:hypothetical protein
VDSTATTTISMKRSLSLVRGSTDEMASAAEAPRMATDPPKSMPWARFRPRRLPRKWPTSSVVMTAETTMAAVDQPSPGRQSARR